MKDASHSYWEGRWSQTSAESLQQVLQPYHQGKDAVLYRRTSPKGERVFVVKNTRPAIFFGGGTKNLL